jgi:hemerythrin-like metal-binding protein
MTVINWGQLFVLGFGDIDDQHHRMIDLINEFDDAMRAGRNQDVLASIFHDLTHYTVHHFAFEEQLMDEYRIRSAPAHKAEHELLKANLAAFHTKIESGSATGDAFMALLRAWLGDHTLSTDQTLTRELLAVGAKSTH